MASLSPLQDCPTWRSLALFCLLLGGAIADAGSLDLTRAVVVAPAGLSPVEQKAVTVLIEEVEKRTRIRWEQRSSWPSVEVPVLALGPSGRAEDVCGRQLEAFRREPAFTAAEGFRIRAQAGDAAAAGTVVVLGNDPRGVLFGVGRLLRELRMTPGKIELADEWRITTAPKQRLRGHQLGYRPKTHSYDAWDVPTWDQYLRDLAVFGCNAVELIPPRSDDDADSPHFPLPPMQMMVEMSRLADSYGMDVWVWYPAMDPDYANPKTVEFALEEWSQVLRKLPRLDAVFVPGGDPGHTAPRPLVALLEQQTRRLREFHPQVQMWVSPQSFNQAWLDEFLGYVREQQPAWLSGLVFGPQVRVSAERLRSLVPAHYPIRHYPDITHSRQCQYPVPEWDVAYAVTEARECINPRPTDEAAIFRSVAPHTIGFITYSEGCNDDVNKAVWSGLGWDPDVSVNVLLREYARYFIADRWAEGFAQGLLALEQNWRGSLLANAGVETTLRQFQTLEREARPRERRNWRFQQALFRAYYDAYTRRRLLFEIGVEEQALAALRQAPARGAMAALADAEQLLDRSQRENAAPDLRLRIHELAAALFQSISMQLSVEKYQAIAVDRGAALDTIDYPLNNAPWLRYEFGRVRKLATEPERLKELARLLDWENPGPGGFYDDLGNPARQPHLVRGAGFAKDPGSWRSPRSDFEEDLVVDEPDEKLEVPRRVSWMDHVETLYDAPLELRYEQLDPAARYRVRVLYAGDNPKRKLRLVANDGIEVHPFVTRPLPYRPLEFDVPAAATQGGALTLRWSGEPGLGGNGRDCQVAEVWLIKR